MIIEFNYPYATKIKNRNWLYVAFNGLEAPFEIKAHIPYIGDLIDVETKHNMFQFFNFLFVDSLIRGRF